MEGDGELKHCCKVCWKRFPNGRSLGGHMRSHLSLNTAAAAAFDADEGENSNKAWRLRENPKKTWRLSDSGNGESPMSGCKLCRVCGKGFPSAKALYGHMKCHSDKCGFGLEEGEWSYGGAQNGGKESQSDSEVTAVVVPKRKRRRRSKRVAAIAGLSASLSSESEKEREDGALSLMMLSRDVKFSVTDSSDKNSVVLEDKESELGVSGNGHLKKGLKKVESDVSVCEFVVDDELDEFGGTSSKGDELKSHLNCDSVKKGRYQCAACNKIFHSYQALGGHRASHKRIDAYFASMEVNSPVESVSPEADMVRKLDTTGLDATASKKGKIHECPICRKVFSSGQALGGHKRSHMFTSSETIAKQSSMPESIDLNLPASIGESSNHGGSEATTSMSHFWFL